MRRNVPESPRWLFIHGREDEGERIVRDIEQTVSEETGSELDPVDETITIRQRRAIGMVEIARTVFSLYPKRTVLCFSLFVGQAFLYNAFFFTYGDTLSTFFGVKQTGWYLAIFAASNFAGALLLAPLFDRVGRVKMISGTYVVSGVLLAAAGVVLGDLNAVSLTVFGAVIFFFASAGASAAYLTASEVFPMETRALCIAFFYAIGTAVGGITGPLLFGKLIDNASADKDITAIAIGYFIGAALMVAGGVVEAVPRRQGRGRVAGEHRRSPHRNVTVDTSELNRFSRAHGTADDQRRGECRGRVQGRRLLRAQRSSGHLPGHPPPHPRDRRAAGLGAEPAGPGAVGVQGPGGRPGDRPPARDPAR